MLTRLRELREDEKGQILYMTLVAMLMLVIFSLVLVNVIYVGVMKIRAQNAADQIALSAATLRARVFNKMTDMNTVLEVGAVEGGRIHHSDYQSWIEMLFCWAVAASANLYAAKQIVDFNNYLDENMNFVFRGNGLNEEKNRVKIFPGPIMFWQVDWKIEWPWYWQETYYPYTRSRILVFWFPPVEINPNRDYLFVQSRVEWELRDEIIGFKALGVHFPDIVTRARAEIFSEALPVALPPQCSNYWQVRLVQPDEDLDRKIKEHDYIW